MYERTYFLSHITISKKKKKQAFGLTSYLKKLSYRYINFNILI